MGEQELSHDIVEPVLPLEQLVNIDEYGFIKKRKATVSVEDILKSMPGSTQEAEAVEFLYNAYLWRFEQQTNASIANAEEEFDKIKKELREKLKEYAEKRTVRESLMSDLRQAFPDLSKLSAKNYDRSAVIKFLHKLEQLLPEFNDLEDAIGSYDDKKKEIENDVIHRKEVRNFIKKAIAYIIHSNKTEKRKYGRHIDGIEHIVYRTEHPLGVAGGVNPQNDDTAYMGILAALFHDYIEDSVDERIMQENIPKLKRTADGLLELKELKGWWQKKARIKQLRKTESNRFDSILNEIYKEEYFEFKAVLERIAKDVVGDRGDVTKFNRIIPGVLCTIARLTRDERSDYYSDVAEISNPEHPHIRLIFGEEKEIHHTDIVRAARVKAIDRAYNILTLGSERDAEEGYTLRRKELLGRLETKIIFRDDLKRILTGYNEERDKKHRYHFSFNKKDEVDIDDESVPANVVLVYNLLKSIDKEKFMEKSLKDSLAEARDVYRSYKIRKYEKILEIYNSFIKNIGLTQESAHSLQITIPYRDAILQLHEKIKNNGINIYEADMELTNLNNEAVEKLKRLKECYNVGKFFQLLYPSMSFECEKIPAVEFGTELDGLLSHFYDNNKDDPLIERLKIETLNYRPSLSLKQKAKVFLDYSKNRTAYYFREFPGLRKGARFNELYKNLILINELRSKGLDKEIPEEFTLLREATLRTAARHRNRIKMYRINPARAYGIETENREYPDYNKVTSSEGPSIFDGVLERYFHPTIMGRVRGAIRTPRDEYVCIIVLTEALYRYRDPEFKIEGLGKGGLSYLDVEKALKGLSGDSNGN